MYNPNNIEGFIKAVTEEADKAAQAVFDRHTPELKRRIVNQMGAGHKLFIGMGSAHFENKNGKEVGEEFSKLVQDTCYPTLDANFSLDDITKPNN